MDPLDIKGLPAADWPPFIADVSKLNRSIQEASSDHAKSILIGRYLSAHVGRPVRIQVNRRSGSATLRMKIRGHTKRKYYSFEVVWDAPDPDEAPADDAPVEFPIAAGEAPVCGEVDASLAANAEKWD